MRAHAAAVDKWPRDGYQSQKSGLQALGEAGMNGNDNDPSATFYFAPEIEDATVSIIWHEPERLAEFLRQFDPNVHLAQPHCRIILEAITLAYGELGTADFPTVVQVVRELGRLEECGKIEGLNRIYSAIEISLPYIEQVYRHYLDMLRLYAAHRKVTPSEKLYLFTAGRVAVRRSKIKSKPTDPDYLGDAKVRGRIYKVRGWESRGRGEQGFTLTLEPQ